MSIRQYVEAIVAQWRVVAVSLVLGLLFSTLFILTRTPAYTATALTYVSSQSTDSASLAYQGGLLSQQRVKSYTDLIGTTRISNDVVALLRLSESPQEVSTRLSATNDANSTLVSIQATDESPGRAADLANAAAQAFTTLVNDLERPSTPGGVQPVAIRTVQLAVPPTSPSSLSAQVILAAGLFIGLLVGLAAAVAIRVFDSRVSNVAEISEQISAPAMGTIPLNRATNGLVGTLSPDVAEALRKLRTNLQYVSLDHELRTVLITSPMPSEGKTSLTCSLALTLSAAGSRVVLLDCDLRNPSVAAAFGLDDSIGLTTIVTGRLPAERAIQRAGSSASLDVIAAGPLPPNPSELLASRRMQTLLEELRLRYDLVLIDSPPLLPVTDAAALAPNTDGVILLAKYKKTKSSQVADALGSLNAVSARLLGCVLTMTPNVSSTKYDRYYQAPEKSNSYDLNSDLTVQNFSTSFPAEIHPVPFKRER